jgi:hypothetical protein
LLVSKRKRRNRMRPAVDRGCVITLDEGGTRVLFEALKEWLG